MTLMVMPMASHDQQGHAALYFDCLHIKNIFIQTDSDTGEDCALHIHCSGLLGKKTSARRLELCKSVEMYLKDDLEKTVHQWYWGSPCTFV